MPNCLNKVIRFIKRAANNYHNIYSRSRFGTVLTCIPKCLTSSSPLEVLFFILWEILKWPSKQGFHVCSSVLLIMDKNITTLLWWYEKKLFRTFNWRRCSLGLQRYTTGQPFAIKRNLKNKEFYLSASSPQQSFGKISIIARNRYKTACILF